MVATSRDNSKTTTATATTTATEMSDLPTPTTRNKCHPTRKTQANTATLEIPVLKLKETTKSIPTVATKNRSSALTVKVFPILSALSMRDTRRNPLQSLHQIKRCMSLSLFPLNNQSWQHLRKWKNLSLLNLPRMFTKNNQFKQPVVIHRSRLSVRDLKLQRWWGYQILSLFLQVRW